MILGPKSLTRMNKQLNTACTDRGRTEHQARFSNVLIFELGTFSAAGWVLLSKKSLCACFAVAGSALRTFVNKMYGQEFGSVVHGRLQANESFGRQDLCKPVCWQSARMRMPCVSV